jgi:hypothetical protein
MVNMKRPRGMELFLLISLGGLRFLVHFHRQPIRRDIKLLEMHDTAVSLSRLRVRPRLPLGRDDAFCSKRDEYILKREVHTFIPPLSSYMHVP